MISVLLPSRRRPESLVDSIGSLRVMADNPDGLEILVAADPDDPDTAVAAERSRAICWVAPTRYGYHRLHEYANHLARLASGEWLLLWNDDARMLTPGWDSRVEEADRGVLWPAHNDSHLLDIFPIVHRSIVETLGHFSLSPHCDSWMQDIATAVGAHHRIPVTILHDRHDLTGGHNDQTWRDAQAGYRTADYHSPPMQAARARDIETLKAAWTPERTP
ncbi:glycosyltransferase family 2 protein [Streptosporangium sp. CA-115845]|uniref:glycosyltransferase family 2 protein n=1 Tax=Streptosporangium sp. CA-115845 TaxID=3240071 RepID=UPI003D8BF5CE